MKRATNGPVWNEYAAYFTNYTVLNYAHIRATTDNEYVKKKAGKTVDAMDFKTQVGLFIDHFGGKLEKKDIKDDVIGIGIGPNDLYFLSDYIGSNPKKFISEQERIIRCIINAIERLRRIGYRKFLVIGFPYIKTIPILSSKNAFKLEAIDVLVKMYNANLASQLEIYRMIFWDSHNSENKLYLRLIKIYEVQEMLMNEGRDILKSLGIESMDSACYFNGKIAKSTFYCRKYSKFFYYDDVHPTTPVHALFGALAAESITNSRFDYDRSFVKNAIKKYNLENTDIHSGKVHNRTHNLYFGPLSTSSGIYYIENRINKIIEQKKA
ncbi:hypothetical protein AYI70_g11372 [Smittium culicis]|uniref:GDSL esterase/lipase n=1 Tax=Smittium culicis TaxID=133412 RepID=A0A1R1X265_9FUNG|nr:hypothetical protein AYI70_g11372 [Smittium culicis]